MPVPSEQGPAFKQQPVANTCQICHAMKSKCDGKQPDCGRCAGNGYACTYSSAKPHRPHSNICEKLETRDFDRLSWPIDVVARRAIELPNPEEEIKFTDIYFSTIHLAYPFIPQSSFMKLCDKIRNAPSDEGGPDSTEIALYYVICAIGAYYTSFPGRGSDARQPHEVYFQRAVTLAASAESKQSILQVSFLLAQCFYFLVVFRMDSCWATLGQTIRTAQNIGLHVETEYSTHGSPTETERRRRIWYSIYVLDRLVSLQLGRLPPIQDGDCSVPLPSRLADCDIDWDTNYPELREEGPSEGDHFLAIISFSQIVGRVLQDIYSPGRGHLTPENTTRTQELDRQLIEWKLTLPRRLRFDLGHVFDQSFVFKRQRNMLAVRFHHLRALLHRPYICSSVLRHVDDASTAIPPTDWSLVSLYERTCVAEARETARLLHGVSSQEDLVLNFPWWQMISCLICAGSILLVSSNFTQLSSDDRASFDAESLYDDAETCLEIFEALSVNSLSAEIARDMMEGLKECGIEWRRETRRSTQSTILYKALRQPTKPLESQGSVPSPSGMHSSSFTLTPAQDLALSEGIALTPRNWPSEIQDSMAWSAQFLEAIQRARICK